MTGIRGFFRRDQIRQFLGSLILVIGYSALPVIASVEWTANYPQVVINQGFLATGITASVPATVTLISSTGTNGGGANQDYKIKADQLGQSSFLLVNIDNPAETIPFTLTYQDGASQALTENSNSTSNFSGKKAGSNPQITLSFTAPGFIGLGAWNKSYLALIDLCAFKSTINCGEGGGSNVQYDTNQLVILFRGFNASGGYVMVSGIDDLPMIDQGANWSANDDFCVGVVGATNVRIRADSQTGVGIFQMEGATPFDLLSYQLQINGTAMAENTFQSFVGQSFSDCINNINGFTIDATADNSDVGNAAAGSYSDVITITVEPI